MNRAIIYRWLNVVMLSLIRASVGGIILDWQCSSCMIVAHSLGKLSHSWVQSTAIVLFCAIVAKVYLHLSPFYLGHLRFILRYPPTWVAIFLAVFLVGCLEYTGLVGGSSNRYDAGVWSWTAVAVLAGCLLLALVHSISSPSVNGTPEVPSSASPASPALDSPSQPGLDTIAENWNALKQWIATDLPITRPSQDLLNRTALVHRFADRLVLPFDQSVTIGLVGHYGSGKTSVVRLTQEEVASRRTNGAPFVSFCNIDCWGFEDSGVALQNILASVLRELSKKVDCLALNQLPESYRNLLAGGGGWWASVATFMSDPDPQAQLRQLTPILRAMNARLVLVLEELDRLRCMGEWSESPSNSTLAKDLCSSSRFVQIWEYFTEFVPVPNLLDLAGQVLDLLRQRDGVKASGSREAGAVIALWRRAHKKIDKNDNSRDWLLDQINRSVATSLRLANDLYHYWASIQYGVVKTEQDRNIIRQALVEQAKKIFSAEAADALVKATDPEYPYSIYHLVRPADQKEPPSILTQPSDWRWLSAVLLDAAGRAPARIMPQIALLITDSSHDSAWETHTQWNQALLEGMFGDDLPRLMEILTTDFQMSPLPSDPAAGVKVENVRNLARQWCSEQSGQLKK